MNPLDYGIALFRALKIMLAVLSIVCILLAFAWLFMFSNFVEFSQCALLGLLCALISRYRSVEE